MARTKRKKPPVYFKKAKFNGVEYLYTEIGDPEDLESALDRRAIYIKWSRDQARKVLSEDDYNELIEAIDENKEVIFYYTDKNKDFSHYKKVKPIEFILTPGYYEGIRKIEDELNPIENGGKPLWQKIAGTVYLWAYHDKHKKKESFYAETIIDVNIIPTLLEAIRDPSKYWYYWKGLTEEEKEVEEEEVEEKEREEEERKKEEEVVTPVEELLDALSRAKDEEEKYLIMYNWLKDQQSPSPSPFGGPSTDIEHEAYTIDLKGITLYFDDLNDAVVTLAMAMLTGPPLPKVLLDLILGLQIVEEDARGGPDVVAMNADGFITIFGDRMVDLGVIAHETAHELAIQTWGEIIPAEDSEYAEAIDSGEPPINEYSLRNRGEDFAEACRLFITDPEELKRIAPLRYEVIKRMMEETAGLSL